MTRPISYCANVHPGETWDTALDSLRRYAGPIRRKIGRPLAVGLWMSAQVLNNGRIERRQLDSLREWMANDDVQVYTMNAFPFGNFHAAQVKEDVYRPDWTTAERTDYTRAAADLLADLLAEGSDGSLSTVPLALGRHHPMEKDTSIYFPQLLEIARHLAALRDRTGKTIRLAIEPEPACVLERTDQAVAFFKSLWKATAGTADEALVREHLGLCYDVCHQAVEFESIADSLALLKGAGVRIVKLHMSCALELVDPTDAEARGELSRFAEPKYLHQTFGLHPSGRILKLLDLTAEHALSPNPEWEDCRAWRTHFHVPIHLDEFGRLRTTRPQLEEAVAEIVRGSEWPHLEVETYTWSILSQTTSASTPFDLVEGIAAELDAAEAMIARSLPDSSPVET